MGNKKPEFNATTLWDFSSQNYGGKQQGDINYIGATPSYVIWNLLKRYSAKNDLIVDPFCGSGTTIDVAHDLERNVKGFDINPIRDDIIQGDARKLPLPICSADFIFMDPPYSDHIHYSDNPDCIGKISSFSPGFFKEFEKVAYEANRVLKKNRYLALYVCDFYKKGKGYVPTGIKLFNIFSKYFVPIDTISVVRHNNNLKKGNHLKSAQNENFFLRGFNYLFIFKKPRNTRNLRQR